MLGIFLLLGIQLYATQVVGNGEVDVKVKERDLGVG